MAKGALDVTFKATRVFQAACMVAIIGMTSNFVAHIVYAQASPPDVLIGTLSVVSIAILYCIITFILSLDNMLPYVATAIVDFLFLIALIVVSVVVGKPLSFLDCEAIGRVSRGTSGMSSSLDSFITQITNEGGSVKGTIKFSTLIGTGKSTCYQIKTIWGLCIALCILFTISSIISVFIWKRARASAAPGKEEK